MIEPLIRAQGAGSRARFAGVPKDRLSGLKRGLVDGAESTCSLGDLEALSAVVLGRSMGIVACRRSSSRLPLIASIRSEVSAGSLQQSRSL